MKARWLKLGMNLWPPFRGAGIRVINGQDQLTKVRAALGV